MQNNQDDPYVTNFRDPEFQNKIREGALLELQRFRVAEQFPASQQMAEVHYKANMFGIRNHRENRVCPCCLERIKETQFDFCGVSMDNSFLSSDVVLLFAFIRMLIYLFLLRLVLSDTYNLFTSYLGVDCTQQIGCKPSFTQRLTVVNKLLQTEQLYIVDLLNLAFVIFAMLFFACYDRFLYSWYIDMSLSIQTEDDYSLFVTNIPIIQNVSESQQIHYAKGIEQYFNNLISQWLRNPNQNREIYQDYVKVAMNHRHHPHHPPKIVAKINLVWDLYQFTSIQQQKEELQKNYQQFSQNKSNQKDKESDIIYDDVQTMQNLTVLNQAGIELCQQFQLNHYYGFVVSKFLGKAFVSFEYQHFSRIAIERLPKSQTFLNHRLKASFASPPRDVYWENQSVTKFQRFQKQITTFFICAACLFFTFLILLGIKYFQKRFYQTEEKVSTSFKLSVRLFVSLFTIGINTLLRVVIRRLAKYQQHETKSNSDISIMYKSIIAIICNQIINPVAVNLLLGNLLWSSHGITNQIISLLTISIVLNLIRSVINPKHIWSWIKFKWNYRNSPPILKFQDNYNADYALLPFHIHQKYMFYINQLFLISFFAYLVPFGSLMGIIFYLIRYFIDRIMLLRKNSFHPSLTYNLTQRAMVLAETSIFVFALGNYVNKWLYFHKWLQPINLISLGIAAIYTILIWIQPLRKLFFKEHNQYQKLSYSDCVHKSNFFHTYYSLNPATKLASQTRRNIKYIGVNAPLSTTGNIAQALHKINMREQKGLFF